MLSNLLKNKIGCKCLMVIAIIVEEKLLCLLVVVRASEMVGDVTFICLKIAFQSGFITEEDNKIGTDDMSLNLFI